MEDKFTVSAQSLAFEYGIDSYKFSEGLGFDHFYMISPCNFALENYAEVLYFVKFAAELMTAIYIYPVPFFCDLP